MGLGFSFWHGMWRGWKGNASIVLRSRQKVVG